MAPSFLCRSKTFLHNNIKLFLGLVSLCAVFVVAMTWNSSNVRDMFISTDSEVLFQEPLIEHPNTAGSERHLFYPKRVATKSWTGLFAEERHIGYVQDLNITPHDKWIIVDVKNECSDKRIWVPPGWRTVLVLETVTKPKGCDPPSCISFPSSPSKMDLNSRPNGGEDGSLRVSMRHLAYLTAISTGAEVILEADCSISLAVAVALLWSPARRESGLMYSESLLFNPYSHFGAWAILPNAYGDSSMTNSRTYYIRDFNNVFVKHGLSSNSPYISYINANTSGSTDGSGRTFDQSVPPVFVGRRSFSPVVPACSLYRQNSFWSLLLPCFSLDLRCRLLRQVIQQRLFRELDAFSAYFQLPDISSHGVSVSRIQSLDKVHFRTAPSSNYSEGPRKPDSFVSVNTLVKALDAWTCDSKLTFFGCLEEIGDYLIRKRLIVPTENTLIKSWVLAVRNISAVEPDRVNQPWRGVRKTTETRVVLGNLNTRLSAYGSREEKFLQEKFIKKVQTACGKTGTKEKWFAVSQWRRPLITDIVLIVLFNSNKFFFGNLPILETIHRPFFQHIVYCVPNVTELLVHPTHKAYVNHVNIVEAYTDSWYLLYECMVSVAQMNIPGVRGYLHIGDDTLLNTWVLMNTTKDAVWLPNRGIISSVHFPDPFPHWVWWKSGKGKFPWLRAFTRLEEISGLSTADILYPAKADMSSSLSKRLSPHQVNLLDRQLNRTQPSPHPVETFSALYRRISDTRSSFVRPLLDGSEDWEKVSRDVARRFVKSYYHDHNMGGLVQHTAFDIFYVPQSKIRDYVASARHFLSHDVMDELALPAIAYGISGSDGLKLVNGSELWGAPRANPHRYYDTNILFLHPFKLGPSMTRAETRKMFCDVYMTKLLSTLTEKKTTNQKQTHAHAKTAA